MEGYQELKANYENLKHEFETYQSFAENTMQLINDKNTMLEKKIDSLFSIVEISTYINSKVRDENFIAMINDMIIGILGVKYSTIFLQNSCSDQFVIKATNVPNQFANQLNEKYFQLVDKQEPFLLNSKKSLILGREEDLDIHSIIGVPIYIREKDTGYIIVEHTLYGFFNYDHIKFVASIANQVGVALENNVLYNQLRESSLRDPLLSIYNRRHFFNVVEDKISKSPNMPFAVVMIDIDNFKNINDMYGHQFGDEVLIETAKLLEEGIENIDIIARYGGEEIVVYLENIKSKEEVINKVDELRIKLSNHIVQYGNAKKSITGSFGISYYPYDSNKLQEVLSIADAMMYNAKKAGKNRVVSS